jgi:hypothetical protein
MGNREGSTNAKDMQSQLHRVTPDADPSKNSEVARERKRDREEAETVVAVRKGWKESETASDEFLADDAKSSRGDCKRCSQTFRQSENDEYDRMGDRIGERTSKIARNGDEKFETSILSTRKMMV